MRRSSWIIVIILGCFGLCPPCWASKAYITDSLTIALRVEPNLEQKADYSLFSGQQVEVMEVRGDWSLVQYENDLKETIKGWVLSRYLITRLPWEIQAKSMNETNMQLEKELDALKKQLKETSHQEDIAKTKLNKLTADLQASRDEYNELKKESFDYISLKSAFEAGKNSIEQLTKENQELRTSEMNRWILNGALILLCGLLIGVLFGRQERKRKAYY